MLETIKIQRAINRGDYAGAISIGQKLLEKDEKDVFALHMLALCYHDMNDFKQSAMFARMVLEIEPGNFELLNMYSNYCIEQENYTDVYRYVCQALEAESIYPIEVPEFAFWFPRLISLFRKFRNIEKFMKESIRGMNSKHSTGVKWAREYKLWYESKKISRPVKSLH